MEVIIPRYEQLDWSASSGDLSRTAPVGHVQTAERALADVIEVLRLAETGQVKLTPSGAEVGAAGLRSVSSVLEGPDLLDGVPQPTGSRPVRETEGSGGLIRAFAWPRLLVAGGLAKMTGGRLTLTNPGRQVMGAPPANALRSLWRSWLGHADDDEIHRLARIKGTRGRDTRLLDVTGRRRAIADALRDCPIGGWVGVDVFFAHIRAARLDFQIVSDLEQIRLEGLQDWSLDQMGDDEAWPMLQGRYILCFLMEYAATLGVIDVAYTTPMYARPQDTPRLADGFVSRYDGLRCFITSLGAYCLGRSEAFAATPIQPATFSLGEDLVVDVTGGALSRADEMVLRKIAEPIADGRWNLSRRRALESAADGYGMARAKSFLESRSDRPLPMAIAAFIADCAGRADAVRAADAGVLFDCGTEARAQEISSAPSTRGLSARPAITASSSPPATGPPSGARSGQSAMAFAATSMEVR